jgi:alcohol dehydrogenase, propanol-preferring
MKAMVLKALSRLDVNLFPLESMDLPVPIPAENEILVKVSACGVCHTELDEIEGRTPPPLLPIVPGHQVVGTVAATGNQAKNFQLGERVGIAWIFSACGKCKFCLTGYENLCPDFRATGRDAHGGYAQYMTVPENFAYRIPEQFTDSQAAPLLCAGAIGYRSLRLTGIQDGQNLGLTGFGASAHIVLKMVQHHYPNVNVFAFSRSAPERTFATQLGAVWAGDISDPSPQKLDCIIDTTPVWKPVLESLKNLEPGGRLVINAIRKETGDQEELLRLDYPSHLWLEKEIKSVANVTRADVREFLALAADMGLKPEVQEFALGEANTALVELKTRKIHGAKVLRIC